MPDTNNVAPPSPPAEASRARETPDSKTPDSKTPDSRTADSMSQHIDAVAALTRRAEKRVSRTQRAVEALTAFVATPHIFIGLHTTVAVSLIVNLLAPHIGVTRWDEPPFFWMQGAIGLLAVLMTTMILITQNRQGEITSRLEHLDLQMSLLTEQKTAKIIELLEEMRRDSPTLPNRVDMEAEALKEASDPEIVLTALEFKLKQVLDSATDMERAAIKTEAAVEEAIEEVTILRQERILDKEGQAGEPR